MIASLSRSSPMFPIAIVLVVSACSAGVAGSSPESGSSPIPTVSNAGPSARPEATLRPMSTSIAPGSLATSTSSAEGPPPAGPGVVALTAGTQAAQVVGGGTYPGYTVALPDGWSLFESRFVVKYPETDRPAPVLGLSVWAVGQVYLDPCHWQSGATDPGPSVKDLVAALVAQPMRDPSTPIDVTLAGSRGTYLELSVPADLKSSAWTDFDACDLEPSNGHHDFRSWIGAGMGHRFLQVPGQVERVWVLDVHDQRLVVDATYSPDTTQADRDELGRVVGSLRFVTP